MRKRYLQDHRKVLYNHLLLSGKLRQELCEVDTQASDMVRKLVAEMATKGGTASVLKMRDQMHCVGLMNNYKSCAEEVVLKEIVYV